LWINDLDKCFNEIYRILKTGGILLILSEPDYGGLIEERNTNLKDALITNLKKCGANPFVARNLNQQFPRKFEVKGRFSISVPWSAHTEQFALTKEWDFFKDILADTNFDGAKMRLGIERVVDLHSFAL